MAYLNYFMSSLWVLFCLLGQCEYEDTIEFEGKDGNIQVHLHAKIPCHALEVPDSVQLPLCAVEHSSFANFQLKNARCVESASDTDIIQIIILLFELIY